MRFILACLVFAPIVSVADEFQLPSHVTSATLYPGAATLTRDIPFQIPAGRHTLVLSDLPLTTDFDQLRVSLTGATLGAVSSRTESVPPRDPSKSAAVKAAEARVEGLEDQLRTGEAGVDAILTEQTAALARIAFLEKLGTGEGAAQMPIADIQALVGMIGQETEQALKIAQAAKLRADAANRDLDDTREALERARKALDALLTQSEERALLTIEAQAETETSGTLTVRSLSYDAGWRPAYDFRLDRAAERLTVVRSAMIEQSTGEDWQDVALTISTVRPTGRTNPSEVQPIGRRIFDPVEKRVLSSPQRDLGLFMESAGQMGMIADESAMPSVAFDGLVFTYSFPEPIDIANGADSVRLNLGELETEAEVRAHAAPLFDQTAYLVAHITNDTGELILPSRDARVYSDGQYIGRTEIQTIAPGAKADLAFGPIEGLRLSRTILDRNEGDRGILSKSNETTEDVRLEIENLTDQNWPLRVVDRVPYTEQEDLIVSWKATPMPSETDSDGKRGVLTWEFDSSPGQTTVIELSHSLRWPEGMILR